MLAAPLLSVLSLSYLGKFVWTAWGQDPCFLCIFPVPWQGGIDGWMLFGVMERNRQTRRMYSNMHWWHSVWINRELDLPVEFGSTEERMLLHPASLAKHIAHRNLNLAWVVCVCLLCVWVCSRIEVCVVQQMFWTCSSTFGLLMPRIHSQRSYLDLSGICLHLHFCVGPFAHMRRKDKSWQSQCLSSARSCCLAGHFRSWYQFLVGLESSKTAIDNSFVKSLKLLSSGLLSIHSDDEGIWRMCLRSLSFQFQLLVFSKMKTQETLVMLVNLVTDLFPLYLPFWKTGLDLLCLYWQYEDMSNMILKTAQIHTVGLGS